MRKAIGFIILVSFFIVGFTTKEKEKINWVTVAQLNELYAKNPKPILIDIYTDWCGWCKRMDKTTYQNEKLASYVNAKYYAVRFDAETKSTLTFNGKQYAYSAQNRAHQLAIYLTGGQLSYPTTVFMSATNAQPAPLPGYLKPAQMEAPMKYFGEKADATQTFVEFNKALKKSW